MAKLTPIHPGNGNLHWGRRIEVPNPISPPTGVVAVPVTLLRPKGDLVMDRLRHAVWARATKTHTFRLMDVYERKLPDAPEGAGWTAWVMVESR